MSEFHIKAIVQVIISLYWKKICAAKAKKYYNIYLIALPEIG